ncbi:hypothetical protein SAMN04490239_1229 [Rhodococcus koreensis]|uniref:Uncharacterized protein n=1 Tax=Rhodococcus koreensis TaxID=99653 RepID=A0A1H4LDJ6_9NOCA|nr:hypothetical protein SAMN04490239_1229 [Rhodococcus koreensis]
MLYPPYVAWKGRVQGVLSRVTTRRVSMEGIAGK